MINLICYPKCGTCKKAQKWLEEKGLEYAYRDIKLEKPSEDELKCWQALSGRAASKLFNTSGQLYRSMNIKDRLPAMSDEEIFSLLATDGMLVKRPILIKDDTVLFGFKETEWETLL